MDLPVLYDLKKKADVFRFKRNHTYYALFSKSGFTDAMMEEARKDNSIMLVGLKQIMEFS